MFDWLPVNEDKNVDVNGNNLKWEKLTWTFIWEKIRNEARKFIDNKWWPSKCYDIIWPISDYLSRVDVSLENLDTKFEQIHESCISSTCSKLLDLKMDLNSPKSVLEKNWYLLPNWMLSLKAKWKDLAEILKNSWLNWNYDIFINWEKCINLNGVYYSSNLNKPLVVDFSDEISIESSENSFPNNITNYNNSFETGDLSNKFNTYIENLNKDPNAFKNLVSEIWKPSENPDFYANQQCADTVVRVLVNFFEKQGSNFWLTLWNWNLVKLSDFSNSIDFCKYVFPRFSASFLYSWQWDLFKLITSSTSKNWIDLNSIQPWDICCIKHEWWWYHAEILLNKPKDLSDCVFLSWTQYFQDLKSEDWYFDENSPYIKEELSDYPDWYVNKQNLLKHWWFWSIPKILKSDLWKDIFEEWENICFRRLDFDSLKNITNS